MTKKAETFRKLPDVPPEQPDNSDFDERAIAESLQFGSGKTEDQLRKESRENEHNRTETFRGHFNSITIIAMWVMAIGVLAFGLTWAFHVLLPIERHWLLPDQVAKIQNIFTGGVLAGLIADQFRKRMP